LKSIANKSYFGKKNDMKKITFALAFIGLLAFSNQIKAQSFGSAGLELAMPISSDFSEVYGIGMGGTGSFELGLTENIAADANIGIIFFSIKSDYSDFIASSYMIPIQVGGNYYLSEVREGLFFGIQLGMHMVSTTTEDVDLGSLGTVEGESNTETLFGFAPRVGYFINENLSLALRYQIISAAEDADEGSSFIGLRAAYNF